MKKSKILIVAVIGLLMAVGLILASCEAGGCNHSDCRSNWSNAYCGKSSCARHKASSAYGVKCDC